MGFNGKGYFKGTNRIRRPKQYYSTVLAFKTLDEDALLFLAVNEAKVRGVGSGGAWVGEGWVGRWVEG